MSDVKRRSGMVRVKSAHEAAKRYAEKSLMAFLEGGRYSRDHKPKSLAWILGVIESSGIRGAELTAILQGLSGYGDSERFQSVFHECQRRTLF